MQSIGDILRSAREQKGLSIKDVEKGTSIRALYLTAIEEGNYSVVPGEVYLKGFIRNYGNFLGLDGAHLVELYRESKQPPVQQQTESVEPKAKTKTASAGPALAPKWLFAGAAAVLVAATVWWWQGAYKEQQPPVKNPAPAPTAPAPQAAVPTPPPAGPVAAKPVVVAAKFTEECWTQVIADGKEVYEGIPKVDEVITWEADRTITVKAGNAYGIELTYNGQAVGKLGGKGEVITKTFAANTNVKP